MCVHGGVGARALYMCVRACVLYMCVCAHVCCTCVCCTCVHACMWSVYVTYNVRGRETATETKQKPEKERRKECIEANTKTKENQKSCQSGLPLLTRR